MESLPDELTVMILKEYLHPGEVVTCRSVSKRFLFLIDNCINFKELVVLSDHPTLLEIRHQGSCFISNAVRRPMKNMIRLRYKKYDYYKAFPEAPFKIQFSSLKYLEFGFRFFLTKFLLNALNELTVLEKLVFHLVIMSKEPSEQLVLSVPNLKVLSLDELRASPIGKEYEPIELFVSSKIEQLFYPEKYYEIRLNHPECVTHLEAYHITDHFLQLKNLRALRCHSIAEPTLGSLFESFKYLEQINLLFDPLRNDEIERFVSRLMNQRAIRGRSNVKIYYLDILLTKPLDEYQIIREHQKGNVFNVENMRITHYQHLAEQVMNATMIRYNRLVNALDNRKRDLQSKGVLLNEHGFPMCFFEKFQNIRKIIEADSINEAQFAWFLRQCKSLCIFLQKGNTSQFIIDQLSARNSLQILLLSTKVDLDFRPLRRLKNLWELTLRTYMNINPELIGLALVMFKELRYLMIIKVVAFDKRSISIEKKAGLYCLVDRYYNEEKRKFLPKGNIEKIDNLCYEDLVELLS